ncbi:DinB family protein [Thermoflexus sp.]|uniref:DinB family protein n=1 Tax=Thermoflexus sp. TaxID=1969742 RepID=UPI0025E681CC|nr:DinB family protein [Thermoflexus sp.]MDW8180121.1 DinB family protein [Anaerolineae bacterium]MCS6964785.1 DinB family protein [Thermoflexus sp.]MCS7350670.1 DinB family protein [Thermoflexus sp.]MCX7690644.1 DinB family protein [Thermoflexus sp.]MDW8185428.1 DinB family protein [Anaerolineae bacterium]
MSERKAAIRTHLEQTRAEVLAIASRLREADWEKSVQGEHGKWTARQVLAHLAAAEIGQMSRIQRVLAGERYMPEGFNLDLWNERQVQKRENQKVEDILKDLEASRQALLSLLDSLNEEQLDIEGQHAIGAMMTVEQMFYHVGNHERDHAAELRRALE